MSGVPGFVVPSLPAFLAPSFSETIYGEPACVRHCVDGADPALPSQSPQSPGKDKRQAEQGCDGRGRCIWALGPRGGAPPSRGGTH